MSSTSHDIGLLHVDDRKNPSDETEDGPDDAEGKRPVQITTVMLCPEDDETYDHADN